MTTLLVCLALYLTLGTLFAIPFSLFLLPRIDSAAHHTPLSFRLLILPGAAALWPYLLTRTLRSAHAPQWPTTTSRSIAALRRIHLTTWLILGPALLAAFLLLIALAPGAPQ